MDLVAGAVLWSVLVVVCVSFATSLCLEESADIGYSELAGSAQFYCGVYLRCGPVIACLKESVDIGSSELAGYAVLLWSVLEMWPTHRVPIGVWRHRIFGVSRICAVLLWIVLEMWPSHRVPIGVCRHRIFGGSRICAVLLWIVLEMWPTH